MNGPCKKPSSCIRTPETGAWVCISPVNGHTIKWDSHSEFTDSIQLIEILQIYTSLVLCGFDLANKKVIFNCDNMSVVEALKKQSSRCPRIIAVIQAIVLLALKHNIFYMCIHLPGKMNVFTD